MIYPDDEQAMKEVNGYNKQVNNEDNEEEIVKHNKPVIY